MKADLNSATCIIFLQEFNPLQAFNWVYILMIDLY